MARTRQLLVLQMICLRLHQPRSKLRSRLGRSPLAQPFTTASRLLLTLSLCGQLLLPFHAHGEHVNRVHGRDAYGGILNTDADKARQPSANGSYGHSHGSSYSPSYSPDDIHNPDGLCSPDGLGHECTVCALQASATDSTAPTSGLDLTTRGLFLLSESAREWNADRSISSGYSPLGPRAPPTLAS